MVQHILVAHDLTPETDLALQRALQLATQHQARLTLLHIAEHNSSPEQLLQLQCMAEDVLSQRLGVYAGCPAQVLLRSGTPSETILQVLNEQGCDLLVIGSHHQLRTELLGGTNLDRLARRCPTPLLLVCNPQSPPYEQALLALDSSHCASKAMAFAYTLLPSSAQLHGVNIHKPRNRNDAAESASDLFAQQVQIAQVVSQQLIKQTNTGPQFSHQVVSGVLAVSLDAMIGERRPQLLVLGQHSRSRLTNALLGSLPLHYLRHPPCDVLLVK